MLSVPLNHNSTHAQNAVKCPSLTPSPLSTLPQKTLPLNNLPQKLNQKNRLPWPQFPLLVLPNAMRRNPRREPSTITNTLDNARDKRRTIKLIHFPRHRNILINQRLVIRDHILVGLFDIVGFLECVGGTVEEMFPESCVDELQQCDDVKGAELGAGCFAEEEEIQEFETYWVALGV